MCLIITEAKMTAAGAENNAIGPRPPFDSQQCNGKASGAEKPAGGNVVLSSIESLPAPGVTLLLGNNVA